MCNYKRSKYLMRTGLGNLIVLASAFLSVSQIMASESSPTLSETRWTSKGACTSSESWDFVNTSNKPAFWQSSFKSFLSSAVSPLASFSESSGLNQDAESEDELVFAEYWSARALFSLGFYRLSYQVLNHSISTWKDHKPSPGAVHATLGCLNEVRRQIPTMRSYVEDTDLRRWVSKLKEYNGNQTSTIITEFDQLIRKSLGKVTEKTTDILDSEKLIRGRELYAVEKFDEASSLFANVDRKSNDLVETLISQAWSELGAARYASSIGTAVSLRSGAMKSVYAPEAAVVLSMALNEICQYPMAVTAIHGLHKEYDDSYTWLKGNTSKKTGLYSQTIAYIKGEKKLEIPKRILGEYTKSPFFQAAQTELNHLIQEERELANLMQKGKQEEKLLVDTFLKRSKEIRAIYEKKGDKSFDELWPEFEYMISKLIYFRESSQTWKKTVLGSAKKRPVIREARKVQMDERFAKMNQSLLSRLEQSFDQSRLVQVEIYQGASQDLIWQNANPDYEKQLEVLGIKATTTENEKRMPAGSSLDWGRVGTLTEGSQELWEDEIGSFKANLNDQCSNKEKFLALKDLAKHRGTQAKVTH